MKEYFEGSRVPRGYRRVVPGEWIDQKVGGGVMCPGCGCGNGKQKTPEVCPNCGAMQVVVPERTESRWFPGHVEVECCGRLLICDGFTNTCPYCDADYDRNGNRLAPRRLWGEETGEVF